MKILLIFTAVIFGLMILFSQAWAGSQETQFGGVNAQGGQPELQQPANTLMVEQQQLQSERDTLLAQNQQMQQDMAAYQQQNDALIAQQQQLQSEKDALALQNHTLQSGYQQLNGQNQALQAELAADEQMDTTNLAVAFWAGAAVLSVASAVIVMAVAVVQSLYLAQPQSSEALPEPFVTLEPNPWASREYRERAIQKARLIEQWERRSLQVSQRTQPAPVVNHQRRVKQNTA